MPERQTIQIICAARESGLAKRLRHVLRDRGALVTHEKNLDRLIDRFETCHYDILILSSAAFKAGSANGVELIETITAKSPMTQVLYVAEEKDIDTAMSVLKAGSFHYARLPIKDNELKMLIETALDQQPCYGDNLLLKDVSSRSQFQQLIGRSPEMHEIYRQIGQAAATEIPILITGETGTGKDLVAQAIHQTSGRSAAPYLPVNLGALPRELVASELFGHEKGAFTGALDSRQGIFELASDGTVFLDEIGSIDEKVQISLLRLIEHKRFNRLGGRRSMQTNARVITASNEDLLDAVRKGSFREDLYYRLDVFHITVPALRDRGEDIRFLVDEFLKRYNTAFKKNIRGISSRCLRVIDQYSWPGNVRELKNVIQRAALVCNGDKLLPEHLPPRLLEPQDDSGIITFKVGTPLREIERQMILNTLSASNSNRSETARLLGISRRALYNKIKKYSIHK